MTRAAPARRAAYDALRAVISGRLDLPDAVARVRDRLTDERDRSLASEIASGTLRWMGALDAVIQAYTRRPPAGLDAEVLDILRLGAYQLLHLERVPPHAVVSDAVELAREARKSSATALVNAVLRRIDRERDRLPLPIRPDPAERGRAEDYLSLTLSHPRWLATRWLDRVGFEAAEAWAIFDNQPAPLTLRANTLVNGRDELARQLEALRVGTTPARFAPHGLYVTGGSPFGTPLFERGAFLIQDEASQLVAEVAAARPGERVLDACASPGGKTVAMAGSMEDRGTLVAGDKRSRRVRLLAQTVTRSCARAVRLVRADADALPFGPVFDLVLLDAPCSGLGTLRRDPEIRWRRAETDLTALAEAQRRMLESAAAAVRPGGRVVYATCSSEPEENEDLVSAFLAEHPEFDVEAPPSGTGSAIDFRAFTTPAGFFRTWPHVHGLESFFAAVLRRRRFLVNPKHL